MIDPIVLTAFIRFRHALVAAALVLAFSVVGFSQTPPAQQDRLTPDFRVEVWGEIVADFRARVSAYADLRAKLEQGLPPLRVSDNPAEIRKASLALAAAIRAARAKAKQGDIFTPPVTLEFKKALRVEMDAATWEAIMDDNPGEFSNRINDIYPEKRPFSTVPPSILARLPLLPAGIEYRFLGRHLILLDARASVILDRIPYAIRCDDCPEPRDDH